MGPSILACADFMLRSVPPTPPLYICTSFLVIVKPPLSEFEPIIKEKEARTMDLIWIEPWWPPFALEEKLPLMPSLLIQKSIFSCAAFSCNPHRAQSTAPLGLTYVACNSPGLLQMCHKVHLCQPRRCWTNAGTCADPEGIVDGSR